MILILAMPQTTGASEGGEEAFEQLFREHHRSVVGFFAGRGCGPEERSDLAQETFLRAYRTYGSFRGEAKPLTWLLTIATNLWRNRIRDANAAKRDADEVSLSSAHAVPASGAGPLGDALSDQRRRLLRDAIADLPPQMQRCVWLRVYQDMNFRDIAELLGISVGTAKSQVSLARKRLGSALAEHYPELDAKLSGRGE